MTKKRKLRAYNVSGEGKMKRFRETQALIEKVGNPWGSISKKIRRCKKKPACKRKVMKLLKEKA